MVSGRCILYKEILDLVNSAQEPLETRDSADDAKIFQN
jgi:hypothetical protein